MEKQRKEQHDGILAASNLIAVHEDCNYCVPLKENASRKELDYVKQQ